MTFQEVYDANNSEKYKNEIWQCAFCDFKGTHQEVYTHLVFATDKKHNNGIKAKPPYYAKLNIKKVVEKL